MENGFHQPVLKEQAVEYLIKSKDGVYVDCTLGGGGHSYFVLENTSPRAFLIGIDADPEAIEYADQLEIILREADRYPVDGVLYDLGISSYQVDEEHRGFSFQAKGPLDMRFNPQQKLTAAEILNTYPQTELERVIRDFGEERHWRAIAREVVKRREVLSLEVAKDLVEIVRSIVGERFLNKSLARVFQSLRIEVNQELQRLQTSLEVAYRMLKKGGRLVVISYHSLEDRTVKEFFKEKHRSCICPSDLPACICDKVQELEILTRRPVVPEEKEIRPEEKEIRGNPRSRSARLRAGEKIVAFEGGR
jgi:16S rRNA (cytosine1402-N4)-methyltransferase